MVLAKKSRSTPQVAPEAAGAIVLAVSMMYVRLIALVAIFRFRSLLVVAPALLLLAGFAAAYALWLRRFTRLKDGPAPEDTAGDVAQKPALKKNPLELNSALIFAVLFTLISLATKYVVDYSDANGLRMLSLVVGLSDITPFVVSLLQGAFGIADLRIMQAILIASASNNLVKTAYTYAFGSRRTGNLAAPGMIALAIPSLLYALYAL